RDLPCHVARVVWGCQATRDARQPPIQQEQPMNIELLQTYSLAMLLGLVKSLQLVGVSALLGALFAIPMALARNSSNAFLTGFARAYITFFRGTPLLAQLFLIYYGAGQLRQPLQSLGIWWIFRDAF